MADTGDAAPWHGDTAPGPPGARAVWTRASDGVRLRVGLFPVDGAEATALLFPGRTEYAEKYAHVAQGLAHRGIASAAIDWRGQGLADRVADDAMLGHVGVFADYQLDVAAMLAAVRDAGLPPVRGLVAHSMGGAIGYRALLKGLPVRGALFTGPMWGIGMAPPMRPVAWTVAAAGRAFGRGLAYVPTTSAASYVAEGSFERNALTRDREMWDLMVAQCLAEPRFALGGPSVHWLAEALRETRALRAATPPAIPARILVGTGEVVVDPIAVRRVAARWPDAVLDVIDGARHEILMETPEVREAALDAAAALTQH